MELPVTAANRALAPTVAMPTPPVIRWNNVFITRYTSSPMPALETIRPMKVNSGMVAKEYSVTLSPTAIFSNASARSKLSRRNQIVTKDTTPSAIGM